MGKLGWSLSKRRWFGVRQLRSFGSLEDLVSGRLLRIDSTSERSVLKPSSVKVCSLRRPAKIRRIDLINLSQEPPWWEAAGVLKVQSMLLWRRNDDILDWFHPRIASRSSRSAPTKFVPLSDLIDLTWPRRAMNLLRAFTKASVSKDTAISMCTARVTRHVKRTP